MFSSHYATFLITCCGQDSRTMFGLYCIWCKAFTNLKLPRSLHKRCPMRSKKCRFSLTMCELACVLIQNLLSSIFRLKFSRKTTVPWFLTARNSIFCRLRQTVSSTCNNSTKYCRVWLICHSMLCIFPTNVALRKN